MDLELGLVHAAIEVVEEHLLGQRRALAQAQKLEDAVFLGGQVQRLSPSRSSATSSAPDPTILRAGYNDCSIPVHLPTRADARRRVQA